MGVSINTQPSFIHPPFGAALFFLRSVAPKDDYVDAVTSRRVARVTWGQMYVGAIPFVVIQLLMVGLVITFPEIVSSGLRKERAVDPARLERSLKELDAPTLPETLSDPLKGLSND